MADDAYEGLAIDDLLAVLRVDRSAAADSLEQLAVRLGSALGGRVSVDRAGLLHGGAVRSIAIDLGERRYELVTEGRHGLVAQRRHVVRDIPIRTDRLEVDEWAASLADALLAEAERSAEARAALTRLLG